MNTSTTLSTHPANPSSTVALDLGAEGPRARFLSPRGEMVPDTLICSGLLAPEPDGQACPCAEAGRMPVPRPLDASDPTYTSDKGAPGDLCPPCAKQQLAQLGHWQG